MTPAEIERLAMKGAELPDGLTGPEQTLFLNLRTVYRGYRSGHVDRASASVEKRRVLRAYESDAFMYGLLASTAQMRNRLGNEMARAMKSDCPDCRRIAGIIGGLIREDD